MINALRQDRSFYKRLLALAAPMMLQNLMNSSAGMIDTLLVGMLDQTSLAGVSLANIPFFVAMLFVFGLQSGGAVLISQYWGKGDSTTVNRVMGISWYFAVFASFAFATVVFIFPRQIMSITTTEPELIDVAVRYGKIVAYSYAINAFTTVFTGTLRSCEHPLFGTVVVITGRIVDIILDWVLIFGNLGAPALGVEGSAIGTIVARVVEMLMVVGYIIFYKKKPFKLDLKRILRPGKIIFNDFLKYAAPVMLNETLWGLGSSVYPVIYGHMAGAADIVAAQAISGNVERILTIAIFAMAHAAAIIIGREIGSGGSRDKVLGVGKTIMTLSTLVGLASGVILIVMFFTVIRPFLFPLFNLTQNAENIAMTILMISGGMTVFRSYNFSLIVGILRGGGDVKFGMYLDIFAMYLWSVPLGLISGLALKLDFIWVYSLIISEDLLKAVVGFIRFKSGKWVVNVTRDMDNTLQPSQH